MMKQPSTRSLDDLPSIDDLIRLSKAIAMLDAILSSKWEFRYYLFNSNWSTGEMMASMNNGSGDGYFILFDQHGAAIKGFDHESIMSPWANDTQSIWPGMYDGIPEDFASFLNEPAFTMTNVTFCLWRRYSDKSWQCGVMEFPAGNDPDGSEWMLKILNGNPEEYQEFAGQYYEVNLPLTAIKHIYDLKPLTDEIVGMLNSDLTVVDLEGDILEIGYPRA